MILSNAIAGATMQPYPFNMDKLVGASTNEYVGCAFELFEARVRQGRPWRNPRPARNLPTHHFAQHS